MAKKKEERDVFMMDEDDAKNAKNEVSTGSSGLICPKMNKTLEGECKVCDFIQTEIYPKWPGRENQNHVARKWAGKKKAKLNWFVCAVFPENPDKWTVLELGAKAGNQIIDGMENQGWKDILHPHKNKGRMMKCTKKKGDSGYPEYNVGIDPDKADWGVPEDVWKNVPDLKNIISMIQNNELNDDNFQKISSMKLGETISFRLLPPKDLKGEDRKFWIAGVYRHWGVIKGHIDGTVGFGSTPWDEDNKTENTDGGEIPKSPDMELPSDEPKVESKDNVSEKEEKLPSCYGSPVFWNDGTPDPETGDVDESCVKDCRFFKKCGKEVAKKTV